MLLLLDIAFLVVLSSSLGALARRLDQPVVIGEILGGILVGPTFWHGAVGDTLFPAESRPFLSGLAAVGVALFMFVVGIELDVDLVRRKGPVAATVSAGSLLVPFALGTGLAFLLQRNHPTPNRLGFVLFMGAAMAITAFPVLARILTDRGMSRTPLGNLALASAGIGDVLAWSLLAVVVALAGVGTGGSELRALLIVPYVLVMVFAVRPLLRRLPVSDDPDGPAGPVLPVTLCGLLVSAGVTEWIGYHFIFGAFLFGLIMPRGPRGRQRDGILARIGQLSELLFLPAYFLLAGLRVDLSHVGAKDLAELGLIMVVAVGGKFVGAFAAARARHIEPRQSAALATLLNTRGLTELIVLTLGLQLGLLDGKLYSLMVVMAVLTTAMAGPLLRLIYPLRLVRNESARRAA